MASIQNLSARLITLAEPNILKKNDDGKVMHVKSGKRYKLLPAGPDVEVPDEILKSRFVELLVEDDQVKIISEGGEIDMDNLDASKLKELKAFAEDLGIEFDSNIRKADLINLIKEVDED
jgi:hypothetical protein